MHSSNYLWKKIKYFVFFCLILAAVPTRAEVEVKIKPSPLLEGQPGRLILASTEGTPQLKNDLPEINGVTWFGEAGTSTRRRITSTVNYTMYTRSYALRAERTGTLKIPALKVLIGRQELQTDPVSVKVRKVDTRIRGAKGLSPEKIAFTRITWGTGKQPLEKIYIGQESPLTIHFYALEDAYYRVEYPKLKMDGVSYRKFGNGRSHPPRFRLARRETVTYNERSYVHIPFQAYVTPLTAGTVEGNYSIAAQLRVDPSDNQARIRRFLGRSATVNRILDGKIPRVKAKRLPAPPENAHYLGIMGKWAIGVSVNKSSVKAGNPVTLTLNISGNGTIDALEAPRLQWPEFRLFEPEIEKHPARKPNRRSRATIKWVLIPLRQALDIPRINLATFHPDAGEYDVHRLMPEVTVTGTDEPETTGPKEIQSGNETDTRTTSAPDLHYLRRDAGRNIRRPLWINHFFATIALFLLAPASYATCFFVTRRRRRIQDNASLRRRKEALRHKRRVLRQLRNCTPEKRPELIQTELVPFLSAILELPPGTTTQGLADAIQDAEPELAETLRRAEHSAYVPHTTSGVDARDLLKQVRRIAAILVILCSVNVAAEPPGGGPPTDAALTLEAGMRKAAKAYDNGNVDRARKLYQALRRKHSTRPAIMYNLGNCYFRAEQYGRAIAAYERARRLRPRDLHIIDNLNQTRKKVGKPPVNAATRPLAIVKNVRDFLRPDEWLLVLATVLVGLALSAGIKQMRQRPYPRSVLVIACLLCACAAAAVVTQYAGTYKPGRQGVIVGGEVPLRPLPYEKAEHGETGLKAGTYVRIAERRPEWTLVRHGQKEGWVRTRAVTPLW